MIGIIGAMNSEIKSLCSELTNKDEVKINNLVFFTGKLFSKDVVIVKSGIGKVNAALCTQVLIMNFKVSAVLNTGIAGATGEGLSIFDFVISSEAVYHDVDVQVFGYKIGQLPGLEQKFVADRTLTDKVQQAFKNSSFSTKHKAELGLIASGDQFISSKEKKDFIKKSFNPLCVEMEGAAIAQACTILKTPFVIIRALSDCADEGEKSTYTFNEDEAANMSAEIVKEFIKLI